MALPINCYYTGIHMQFIYELFSTAHSHRLETWTRWEATPPYVKERVKAGTGYVKVHADNKLRNTLHSEADMDFWDEYLQRLQTWKVNQDTVLSLSPQVDPEAGKYNQDTVLSLSLKVDPEASKFFNVTTPSPAADPYEAVAKSIMKASELNAQAITGVLTNPSEREARVANGFAENYDKGGNASHYKEVVPGLQYMEMMQYMLSKFTGVEAHLMGQIFKYLMRCGNKDATLQELTKAKWYTDFLLAWHKNGKQPISIVDVEKLIKA